MRHIFETAIILIGTLGWWGFVYPELCMTEETYAEAEAADAAGRESEGFQDLDEFLNYDGKIRIKCKTMEYLYQIREIMDSEKD